MTSSFDWYDRAATRNRFGYQCLRLAALVAGAVVTVLAAIGAPPAITASLAASVVVFEGIQQLFQFHTNWISYRTTAETLRAQALLYAAQLSPYDDPTTRRHRLGTFLSETRTSETTTWASAMKETASPKNRDPGG